MNSTKPALHALCHAFIEQRIAAARTAMQAAQESSSSETKSSAGDKYETGREMMQQEIDRNRKQLEESQKLKLILEQIDPAKPVALALNGALVTTNFGRFYISISRGQIMVDKCIYFAVSSVSPIGLKLMKQTEGYEFDFNGKLFRVEKVE